ncbi:NUDIX hydrolase [Ruegeria arenilitoris]|uniref:NUDIX hydrolase n=1 Tax=Ruegeria arenilitoris TaxID=1173585 RepID=UPI00147E9F0F|nr:NUDIX hydrolase [Ruegeria arenilitoris]
MTWLHKFWEGVLKPLFQRPRLVQFAALCTRGDDPDTQVLLVTSRDTGRWIIPKGWPIDGLNGAQAAAQEAWEEAGVRTAEVDPEPVGSYCYGKVRKSGVIDPVCTTVYRLRVTDLADEFPEMHERTREWVSPQEASERVHEPELKKLLLRI